jgi:hypothetical protein
MSEEFFPRTAANRHLAADQFASLDEPPSPAGIGAGGAVYRLLRPPARRGATAGFDGLTSVGRLAHGLGFPVSPAPAEASSPPAG